MYDPTTAAVTFAIYSISLGLGSMLFLIGVSYVIESISDYFYSTDKEQK